MAPLLNFNNSFGMEISDTEVRIAQIERKGKKLELRSYGYAQIPSGAMQKGEILKQDQVKNAILSALKSPVGKRLSSAYVLAAIPEQHVFTSVINLPTKKRVQENEVQSAALQHIPYPLEDIELDWSQIDHTSLSAHVLVGAAPKNIIAGLTQVIQAADLIPVSLEPQSTAIARSVLLDTEATEPVLLIHFGQHMLTICIVDKQVVYFSSSTPKFSGHTIAEIVSKKLDLPIEKAKKAMQLFGLLAKEGKGEVRRALLPEVSSLLEHIRQVQEYASSHLPAPVRRVNAVYITGEGSTLPGLTEALQSELRIPIQQVAPGEHHHLLIPFKELSSHDLLSSATVIGLALHELA